MFENPYYQRDKMRSRMIKASIIMVLGNGLLLMAILNPREILLVTLAFFLVPLSYFYIFKIYTGRWNPFSDKVHRGENDKLMNQSSNNFYMSKYFEEEK